MEDFIHLHVHTQYSVLDGQASIKKLLSKAVADDMRGMAMTDHGNMMGIKEFFNSVKKLHSQGREEVKTYSQVPDEESESDLKARETKLRKAELKANFKPIFGCEMYVARRTMYDREGKQDQSGNHLIVLAKNETGYHNLIKLVSNAWTDGFYMRPRTDHSQLEKYHEGLIVCSACLAGEVPAKILKGDIEGAEKAILWFRQIFGEDYYLELQRHEVKDPAQRANRETFPLQQIVNKELIRLAKKHDIKLICTNDVHFVDEENAEAHDRLICLSTSKNLDDPTRMLYSKQEWFKTKAEMNAIFSDVPQALANTCEVLDKVETYDIDHAPIMPNFDIPADFGTEEEYRQRITKEQLYEEFTRDENGKEILTREEGEKKIQKLGGYDKLYRIKFEADHLAKLSYEGAERRYGKKLSKEVKERINFELHVMKTMGFPGYFLIVQDYINEARNKLGVSVGPGRGSAAGSVVAYCLGITQIDPLKYDLLFERFLNPDRISLPDIDVDFDDDGRGRVLDWVTNKYGEENCAHIITYGTMATKMALKDVARVEQLPIAESNRLCKLIPDRLPDDKNGNPIPLNLENAVKAIPELQEAEASDDIRIRETFKYARMLEGNVRSTGVHACGFIICKDKISDWVPVSTAEDKESGTRLRCTQYEGKVIEETGLIKMDFLGLKNLSIIKEALENIELSLGIKLDIDSIPIDDPVTYQLFSDGLTIGTFQFESVGMQRYLRELKPTTLGDLIAMNALYRPGPMAYIPQFINRKHGKEPITYDLPCMEKYLKDTYGITVYQEQVMLLSREIAGFTRGESDTLRKAMGKKLRDKLDAMYPKFIKGGTERGYNPKILDKIWKDWESFASYAFNKSHAACYAWIAYQTGYLKANYPAQYMAGAMSRNLDKLDEITKLMDECQALNIKTLGPDINESFTKFSVNHAGDIRFGLAGVKGVGKAAVQAILQERKERGTFTSIYDLIERVNLQACGKKNLENLAVAGAFDSFQIPREAYLAPINTRGETFLDTLIKYGTQYQQEKQQSTNTLFGDFGAIEIAKPQPPTQYPKWSLVERLNRERELIGIFISGHPLDEYRLVIDHLCDFHASDLADITPYKGKEVKLGGIVSASKEALTSKGTTFGRIKIEDYNGSGDFVIFGDTWARYRGYLTPGSAILITARISERRYNPGELDFNVSNVQFLADVSQKAFTQLQITVPLQEFSPQMSEELTQLITPATKNDKAMKLTILIHDLHNKIKLPISPKDYSIKLTSNLIQYIRNNEHLEYQLK